MSKKSPQTDPTPTTASLVATHLNKKFRNRAVVNNVSLAVHEQEIIGLFGPNGAGKTSVFYILNGLLRPDSGQVWLDGREITPLPIYRRARLGIGYLPQESSIFKTLSVAENIMAVLELHEPNTDSRNEALESLLGDFSIEHLRHHKGAVLSGGERRRVEIARTLALKPRFMLLDEPFAGVDPIAIADIHQLIAQLKARGIGVLITDHNIRATLQLIDRAYIIHDGAVLAHGNATEIVAHDEVRTHYLGADFKL